MPDMIPGTTDLQNQGKEQPLSPDQLHAGIQKIIDELETLPVDLVLPDNTQILGDDQAGKKVSQVLAQLRDKIIDPDGTILYEPVLSPDQSNQEAQAGEETLEWMIDPLHPEFKDLIWEKAHDNPLWKVSESSYSTPEGKTRVRISYQRRGKSLRPGESVSLDSDSQRNSIAFDFSITEMQVIRKVLCKYEALELALDGDDEEARENAKLLYDQVMREERDFKRGRLNEPPETLSSEVDEAIKSLKSSRRGFDLDTSTDQISQDVANILSQLVLLNRKRGDGREHVPAAKPWIKETPSFKFSLEKFTSISARQLGFSADTDSEQARAQGFSMVLGEAGTGKNEMVEYFAAKTNRPYFLFSCGRGMESVDLIQHYEFDTKEGTQKFLTNLTEGIQTPGAVVLIDEANALKPEVQAILHGLGDGNRALSYDGVNVPVAEGVIIVIAGNPATYGSAGNFGEAVISRSAGLSMVMDYSALTKADLQQRKEGLSKQQTEQLVITDNRMGEFSCDEALALFPYINLFKDMSDPEFTLLWEAVVNQDAKSAADCKSNDNLKEYLDNPEVEKSVRAKMLGLRDVLKVADSWRKQYTQQTGRFDLLAPSIRDTIAVTKAFSDSGDVKKAYLDCFEIYQKNPRKGLDELYLSLEMLLSQVLGSI